jgi:hypothetical protein
MQEDGVLKVLAGITSLEELERVISLEVDESEDSSQAAEVSQPAQTISEPALSQTIKESTAPEVTRAQPHPFTPTQPSHTKSHELKMLVEYLKRLEDDQKTAPEIGIADKVNEAKNTILELLENSDIEDLFEVTESEKVEREISAITNDLQILHKHQLENPHEGVAQKLAAIRQNLEALIA